MKIAMVCLLSCCAAALCISRFAIPEAAAKGSHSHSLGYRCPMHPAVLQDGEGTCPICGMKLVPVTASGPASDGSLAVTPDQQKTLGIAVARVERAASSRMLRLPGRVTPDETRVYRINAGVEGSFRDVAAVTTGSHVRKDQVLGSYYAPAAVNTIQLFLLNTAGYDRAAKKKSEGSLDGENVDLISSNLQQRLIQFENLGVSKRQRNEMQRTRRIPDTIEVVSPVDGFVLARNASPGFKFERGMELFRIADLRRVWVTADVFPQDAPYVRAGMPALVVAPEESSTLSGRVAEALPQFDSQSRTLKLRIEVDNPGFVLRPDMFVDVQLSAELPEALTVPTDAIADTGLRRTVFVETAPGLFAPRNVETGFRNGDRVAIVRGLSQGERIATSGVFFLDSETRMKAPASGATASLTSSPDPTGRRTSGGGAGPFQKSSGDMQAEEAAAHTSAAALR
ncbi:MAG: efflux RND transporter periplasmic adaptor subunit [Deltaproteobacteria bacterium]|nr:MAG: efflux RND transporter periplasmic adaptor subunit [Deltaproteobacteria bacterium]